MTRSLIAVVGPTATGKTRLALELAEAVDGEIVNADSRQVYRYMDIGTAKPTRDELAHATHHLIDIVDPDQDFNLAIYLEQANEAIESIFDRGKTPLLVGGSGLYVWGLLEGLRVPNVPPDRKLRDELEHEAKRKGPHALHKLLEEMDPEAAERIDPRNVRRTIRALEVCIKSGVPFSKLISKEAPGFPFLVLGLGGDRQLLYERIDHRVDRMIEKGLVEEVRTLLDRGYSLDLPAMSSVGYKQIGSYIQDKASLEDAVQKTKYETHRLARHQGAWFKADDPRIRWLDISKDHRREALREVEDFHNSEAASTRSKVKAGK